MMRRGWWLLALLVANLSAQTLAGLIPSAAELGAFKSTQAPQYYDAGTLWQYIDGGAPGYLAYGFHEVASVTVAICATALPSCPDAGRLEFVADIYDMGNALNAFGIYSTERSPDGQPVKVGSEGYQSDNALFFWQDRYYVKIVSDTGAPAVPEASRKLAAILSRKLPAAGTPPKLFSVFPAEGRVPHSERFLAQDVMGLEFLRGGYVVEYARNGAKCRAFLIPGANAGGIQPNFQKFSEFVRTNGTIDPRPLQIGEESFAGKTSAYGAVMVARQGRYMAGVVGFEDREAARSLLLSILSKLAGAGQTHARR
jgi:hypothetical protein